MKNIIISGLLLCGIIASVHAKEDSNPKLTEPAAVENQATSETITAPKKQNNAAPKQRSVDLETAYKREYAFLEAQKRELIDRLKNYQGSANREEQALSGKIGALERASVERSTKIDQMSSQLTEGERKEAAVTERNDALDTMFLQAESTLKNHAIEMPIEIKDDKKDIEKVNYLFSQALTLLNDLGAMQTKPGHFFWIVAKKHKATLSNLETSLHLVPAKRAVGV